MFSSASKVPSFTHNKGTDGVDLAKILQEYQMGAVKRWDSADTVTTVVIKSGSQKNSKNKKDLSALPCLECSLKP